MSRLICFTLLLISATLAQAETRYYWVLGSFSEEPRALAEQARLETLLGKKITSRYFEEPGVHRLMISLNRIGKDQLGDIPNWLLPLEHDFDEELEQELEKELEEQWVAEEDIIVISEPPEPAEPLYPPLEFEEPIDDYCVREPDSRLCQHPAIDVVRRKDRKLQPHRGKFDGVCEDIDNPRWREICVEMYPSQD